MFHKPSEARQELLSETTFADLLMRERLRAERSGQKFCLLHIPSGANPDQRRLLRRRLRQRTMRLTDAAGWYRGGIAVLMPDTQLAGAERIRDELLSGLDLGGRLYVFPADHLPEQDDIQDGRSLPLESLIALPTPAWKRALDVAGASLGLIVFSPLLLLAAVGIRLSSKGPVLFTQQRAGLGGRPFTIYKFRTMMADAERQQQQLRALNEQDGPAFKIRKDPRVTWLGRYLRKTCIDELPQLWNVLRGEMSLVGPRPLPLGESAQVARWQRQRLLITPGLTCIWQIAGGRKSVAFPDWMRMDIRYLRQRSLRHDLRLILQTARNVLLHRAST